MPARLPPVAWVLGAALLLSAPRIGAQGVEVYVTETGRSYHLDGCPYLQRTRLPLLLPEAAALGYAPCGVCAPPSPPAGVAGPPAVLYRVNSAGLDRCEQAEPSAMLPALVVRHVDGDTVYVSLPRPPAGLQHRERVRLLGVDTPDAGHPDALVQRLGREASQFTRRRLLGRSVRLAFDWQLRDRYGRILAYVYLPDGSCHNAELLRQGYAHAYTRFPFQFLGQFRALEGEARERGRGLWAPQK